MNPAKGRNSLFPRTPAYLSFLPKKRTAVPKMAKDLRFIFYKIHFGERFDDANPMHQINPENETIQ